MSISPGITWKKQVCINILGTLLSTSIWHIQRNLKYIVTLKEHCLQNPSRVHTGKLFRQKSVGEKNEQNATIQYNQNKMEWTVLNLTPRSLLYYWFIIWVWFILLSATFINISAISLWSVLLVEGTGVPAENHRPVASHLQILSHCVVSRAPFHERSSNSKL
jgi:hypothetical protein